MTRNNRHYPTCIVLLTGVGFLFSYSNDASAEKNLKQAFEELGQQLFQLTSSNQEAARKIIVNNQPVLLSTGVSKLSFEEFAAEHKNNCGSNKNVVSGPEQGKATLVCVPEPGKKKNANTGKNSKSEPGRFTFVDTSKSSLSYMTLWSNNLNPQSLLNIDQSKETPGSDFKNFPRPKKILRRFSIHEVGKGFGFAVYADSNRTPSELSNAYFRDMEQRGYVLKKVTQQSEKTNVFSFIGIKDGQVASVVTHKQNGKSYAGVSISKLQNKKNKPSNK